MIEPPRIWLAASAAGLLGALGAWLVSRHAARLGLVDEPCERSSHARPTPKGGGLGILAAFLFAALALKLETWLWLPPALLAVVSLIGDRRELRPRLRLLLQFTAALAVLLGAYLNGALQLLPANGFGALAFAAGLMVFMVGTANFYNFMDGINGLAGLSGIVAFSGLALFALNKGAGASACLNLSLALACAGFLPFNLPRARVFMGDVGSILLGFVFACEVILLAASPVEFMCLTGLLATFYLDEITTMAVRLMDGERLSKAHRRHIYQLLTNELGRPHWQVSTLYALVQLGLAASFALICPLGTPWIVAAWCGSLLASAMLSTKIRNKLTHQLEEK